FNCEGPDGAVLTLPHGADLEKLENLESMRRYAAKHAESWYKYVNETRGRRLVNGSLYLVTGWEKGSIVGMASTVMFRFKTNSRSCLDPQRVQIMATDTAGKGPTAAANRPIRHRTMQPPPQSDDLHPRICYFCLRRNMGKAFWG
ncbi:hypothetical protein B0H14DRAFT_2370947, partial [Mycena olivaceomarginata]